MSMTAFLCCGGNRGHASWCPGRAASWCPGRAASRATVVTRCGYFEPADGEHPAESCEREAVEGASDCGMPDTPVCEAHECRCSKAQRAAVAPDAKDPFCPRPQHVRERSRFIPARHWPAWAVAEQLPIGAVVAYRPTLGVPVEYLGTVASAPRLLGDTWCVRLENMATAYGHPSVAAASCAHLRPLRGSPVRAHEPAEPNDWACTAQGEACS